MTKSKTIDLLMSAALTTGIAIWLDLILTASLRNVLPMYPWDMIVNIFSIAVAYMAVGLSIERWRPSKIMKTITLILFLAAYVAYYTISFMPFR